MPTASHSLANVRARIDAAGGRGVKLLAVSKHQPAQAVRELAAAGQADFGENYVQEALGKRRELADARLRWHMIGPLQSNKCREVAQHFDWLQSLDRAKLVAALAKFRPEALPPLNVLVQVNIDDEDSKSGCAPEQAAALCDAVAGAKGLALRGLMAIPAPHADVQRRRPAFRRLRELFDGLRGMHPAMDTLSMGMSDDLEVAIEEGATLVRVGTALFGPRPA